MIGARLIADRLEWSAQVDPKLVPDLADHKIDGTVLLPGSAFVEMALAVARSWLESDQATIAELDIQQSMAFVGDMSREVMCRVSSRGKLTFGSECPAPATISGRSHASATAYGRDAGG